MRPVIVSTAWMSPAAAAASMTLTLVLLAAMMASYAADDISRPSALCANRDTPIVTTTPTMPESSSTCSLFSPASRATRMNAISRMLT